MKVPYQLIAAVELSKRRENMLSAISRGLPRLQETPIDDTRHLSIACYGPSLQDTWKDLKHPILSMSGATRFLADRGVIADWHIDMDPRPYKVKQITPPVPGVNYLLASVCHPVYFETLKDQTVTLWHTVSSGEEEDLEWLKEHDPGELLVTTGSNIGLGAIQIGGILGFRHFEIHGMDGSFRDGKRHAAEHFGKVQSDSIVWQSQHVKYKTSKIMANGVAEVINNLKFYPIFCVFHGWGLQQSLIEEEDFFNACTTRQPDKAAEVRRMTAGFVDVPISKKSQITCWSAWEPLVYSAPNPQWITELQDRFDWCETLRSKATFNTGTISLETGLLLRSICHTRKPKVVAEVGTFIGKSTYSLQAERIYTCDKDNDCLPSTETIKTHPGQTSTQMFRKLVDEEAQVDVFFFDGRIQPDDLPLIEKLSHKETVYTFDDYFVGPTGKGMHNIAMLHPKLNNYYRVDPYPLFSGRSTLAMLWPAA